MTSLEIFLIGVIVFLICTLALTLWFLRRLHQKHLVLRHIFMTSSDWCAHKIEAVSNYAIDQISELVCERASDNGMTLSWKDAQGYIMHDILDAKKSWGEQVDAFQVRLMRNGIQPLSEQDLIVPPWRSRIKEIK